MVGAVEARPALAEAVRRDLRELDRNDERALDQRGARFVGRRDGIAPVKIPDRGRALQAQFDARER